MSGVKRFVCVLTQENYKAGDQPPTGYLDWHEWAEAQHKAGLKQQECGRCGLWRYPQELSDQIDRTKLHSKKGIVTLATAVCNKCSTNNTSINT